MRSIFVLLAWLALAGSQAFAEDDTILWDKVGGWQIRIDPSIAGCFMFGSWTQGELVRIGVNNELKKGYLLDAVMSSAPSER